MSEALTRCNSPFCNDVLVPEDAVYDDRTSAYYCDMTCFYDWAYENDDEVTEYYVTMNLSGG